MRITTKKRINKRTSISSTNKENNKTGKEHIIMKLREKYDIIIENAINDWRNSMMTGNKRNQWEVPKYSKSEINKSGSIIADSSSSKEERDNALVILNNWRAAHAYPLQVICNNLRLRNPNAIVVQRLKRLDSITGKIKRFPNMNLYRMQDLGGCRIIVDTIEQVYDSVEKYRNSRIRHILKREYDYIQNPKDSGYRSYHMVYQFHSDKKETYNKNMLIEIQFRTKLQHIWATAVEMMGIYTKSNLKSSQGDGNILRFFTLVSSVIALQENMSVCPGTTDNMHKLIQEIKLLNKTNNITSILSGINQAVEYTQKKITETSNYYLLILDYATRIARIAGFKPSQFETATNIYEKIEKETDKNVVLVSAKSFSELREAYPNYFLDISKFIDMIQKL